MTTYRCVCPYCTAYICSSNVETFDEWQERAERWLANHICGWHAGDGIEKPSQFALYETTVCGNRQNDRKTERSLQHGSV